MLVRSLVFLSVAGLLLVACNEKDEDTAADTSAPVDTAEESAE